MLFCIFKGRDLVVVHNGFSCSCFLFVLIWIEMCFFGSYFRSVKKYYYFFVIIEVNWWDFISKERNLIEFYLLIEDLVINNLLIILLMS